MIITADNHEIYLEEIDDYYMLVIAGRLKFKLTIEALQDLVKDLAEYL